MTFAVGEIAKRHLETAANFGVEAMHGAGEAIGRQPFRHGVGCGKGAIDLFGLRGQNAVQSNGTGHVSLLNGCRQATDRDHICLSLRASTRGNVPFPAPCRSARSLLSARSRKPAMGGEHVSSSRSLRSAVLLNALQSEGWASPPKRM